MSLLLIPPLLSPTTIAAFFVVLAAVIGGSITTYRTIQKLRKNARAAKDAEEAAIQKRIDEAVALVKLDVDRQIEMATQLTAHWKEMAEVLEREKLHDRELALHNQQHLEGEVARLRAERQLTVDQLAEARMKIETILDLNLGYQGQIAENARHILELQDKVELIDGKKSQP